MTDRVVNFATKRITQAYGHNGHHGVDIGHRDSPKENYVYANCKGVVTNTVEGKKNEPYNVGSFGNYVTVKHPNGIKSFYAHLSIVHVSIGDNVDENTILGEMGNTGYSFGKHLHFAIKVNEQWADPTRYLTEPIWTGETENGTNTLKNVLYEVQKGDNLTKIGKMYNKTWQEIYEHNKGVIGSDPNKIYIGQVLEIPNVSQEPTPIRKTYTVKKGDTMWGIAKKNGMTLTKLVSLNSQIKDPNKIYVGDTVYLS